MSTITVKPDPKDVKEAIRLKCANCYGALSMFNALGGSKTKYWELCHTTSLKDLIAHAKEEGIDLTGLKSSVDEKPIEETLYYKRATGSLTEKEFQLEFYKWQKGG